MTPDLLPKLLLYLGAALLVGGAAARRLLTPGHPGLGWLGTGLALLILGGGLGVSSTLSSLGFTAPADILDYLTGTGAGRAVLVLWIGGLVLLAAELAELTWLAVLGASGVLLWGLAGIGHGASHGQPVHVLHTLHGGAMCLWVGGVFALLSSAQATTALARRFTPYALGSVLVLGVSGVWMSLEHAGNLWQLPASGYGRTLLLKVGLVGLALGAAVIVRRAFALDRGVRPRLAAEALTLLAVLGVTASLSGQAPPGHTGTEHSGH
ncbi:CopD family protein [Deinococcus radiopugnans]|uniref:Copper export protein n=1 Tax=Deinococcus radiopugnans ATCC 19172 TaxID=585398 RepID=A0ABR6NXY3_9DEIO|nr:CopD family protein [Deinococcus radiopugnans]MBB6018309.1 putative copper export protein [Deinococcus radiopugnans ATCC 19172]